MSSQEVKINLWNPHKNQEKIITNNSRYKVIVCGRRFGKTTYAVNKLIEEALLQSNTQYFYVAPTYRQAKMIAWRMLESQANTLPKELVLKKNESELYIVLGNNSRIDIKGADNPDSLRGVGLNGVVLDEYADIKPHVYDEIIAPALVDNKGFAIFIGTPKGFNHFYDLYNEAGRWNNWSVFQFTSYDNPYLDREELDKERERITEDKFAQEYLADFRKQEGLVYKEFSRDYMTYTGDVQRIKERICGVDFGYNNPAAILEIFVDFDDNYYIHREYYKTEQTDAQIAEYAASIGAQHYYPDPENAGGIKELRNRGCNVREVKKHKGSVQEGIQKVRELFKQGRLHINKECVNTIFELENYVYEEKEDKNQPEEPRKLHDHALDALRYVVLMRSDKRVMQPLPQPPREKTNIAL